MKNSNLIAGISDNRENLQHTIVKIKWPTTA